MGIDILLDRLFSAELIRKALLKLVSVEKNIDCVVVCRNVPVEKLPESCRLLVVTSEVDGQMRQLLELYFHYDFDMNMRQLVIALCNELKCRALISDDDANPYSRIEIAAGGKERKVMLDSSALDFDDEYIIV